MNQYLIAHIGHTKWCEHVTWWKSGEITLVNVGGHSGEGVYAYYTDLPEEGSCYLGISDSDAILESEPRKDCSTCVNSVEPFTSCDGCSKSHGDSEDDGNWEPKK